MPATVSHIESPILYILPAADTHIGGPVRSERQQSSTLRTLLCQLFCYSHRFHFILLSPDIPPTISHHPYYVIPTILTIPCRPYHTNHTMLTISYQPYHANHTIPTIPRRPFPSLLAMFSYKTNTFFSLLVSVFYYKIKISEEITSVNLREYSFSSKFYTFQKIIFKLGANMYKV